MAQHPQEHGAQTGIEGGVKELPLIQVVHQRQGGPGRHQQEQHADAGVLKTDRDMGDGRHRTESGHQDQGHGAGAPLPGEAQEAPHCGGRQGYQRHDAHRLQARVKGVDHIDGLHRGVVVDIVFIDQHQKQLHQDGRPDPEQAPVQCDILLTAPLFSLILVHCDDSLLTCSRSALGRQP